MSTPESTSAVSQDRAKGKNISALRGLLPFLRPYRLMVFSALFMLTFTAIISLILPLAVRGIIDGFDNDIDMLNQYFGYAILIAALLAIGSAIRYKLVTELGERIVSDIRRAVYDKMIGMSPAFFERLMTGEVLSRITTDTTLILSVIGSYLSFALRNAIMFIGGIVMLMLTSAKLTGLVLILVPLVLMPIFLIGRRVKILSKINQDKIAESSGNASESLLAAQTVQAFTHENASRKLFGNLTEQAFAASRKRIIIRAIMTAIVIFMIFIGIVSVIWVGTHDVKNGTMTAGILVQFVIYAIMVGGSVTAFAEFWGEMQRAAGATERLVELFNSNDIVQDLENPKQLPAKVNGHITFNKVTFRYPARPQTTILDNFTLEILPGETVAFVGPSGAGKSTIFQLLLRFFDPDEGEILLDNYNIATLKREKFRQHIALVPQDSVIFGTTAMENIRFGRPNATDGEVITAAKAAAAHDFLSTLPNGYNSYVGEQGVMLSGGQKQRLAIARAVLRNGEILLLDEATSALDAESENAVQRAVETLSQQRTTLIIAHRLATIKKADRIIVIDKGKIVAQGTHEHLITKDGLYARLAKLQFT